MNIKVKLEYIGFDIFNIERYSGSTFIQEKSGVFGGESGKRLMTYDDGITIDVVKAPTEDEYLHLVISVYLNGDPGHHVEFIANINYPVVVTFRVYPNYCEDMSLEGGKTEELLGGDTYILHWRQGEYLYDYEYRR